METKPNSDSGKGIPSDRTWILVVISTFVALMADGMNLMFLPLCLPALAKDFALTNVEAGALATYSLVGMGLGGILGGWAADRYGRVRIVVWSIVAFSVGNGVLGFSQTYWQFALIRFLSAFGLGAEYAVGNILVAEYVLTNRRSTMLGTVQAGYAVGYVIASLLGGWLIPAFGWRWLFLTSMAPVVLALCISKYIPEPAVWLLKKNNEKIALEMGDKPKAEWSQLFQDPQARKYFLLWAATSTFLQFGFFGVQTWLPSYLVTDMGINFRNMTGFLVGTYTAMILGKVITGWMADRLGRRALFALSGLVTAGFLPFIVMYRTPGNIVYLLVVFGFLYGMPYAINATYMAESFDGRIRSTAMGTSYNLGRVGGAIAPAVLGAIATKASIGWGLVAMGGAYLLAGLLPGLFIPQKLYDCQSK